MPPKISKLSHVIFEPREILCIFACMINRQQDIPFYSACQIHVLCLTIM